ncbi:MFS transporter, NNP family, nitrate/nitrite transporter [Haloplanus vescus]|uniref:MFS transporter, NNP family, nitrate/nitrite transporter n=1 Tax=Haloplanus vescus TaxID=555874 RepID=A0A1H3X3L4_9EURY|nr:MFS transporter [Haloplanus vescus]SDZ93989.1 MFS transporter, NNP family, nitrate/nitrite transporter [Haloplanus vescus]
MTNKIEQLVLATVAFFWAFLLWFSTAAFSPSIGAFYGLTTGQLALLASSAIWLAPPGRVLAGWAADRLGAHNVFTIILAYSGLVSIASAYASGVAFLTDFQVLFIERMVVASAGVSFVVGIQHVAQWFDEHEIGTAEGLYAGTGNVGAGVGALLLPRIYGTNFSEAFLHLGVVALIIAAVYKWRGQPAKDLATAEAARENTSLGDTLFVWTRFAAIALMLAYAMSFGLEIAMNSWLPSYYAQGFDGAIADLGFTGTAAIQTAAGTFAAVQSFNASLFRPFSGYMSDLWQRKGWTPYPVLATNQSYSPRVHWLMTALVLITLAMVGLTLAGLAGLLPVSVVVLAVFGVTVSFGTGGVFAIVPVIFEDRPGTASGFIGGVSTSGGIVYPLVYGYVPNIHTGYAVVALVVFVPIMCFYVWAMRYEETPRDHGFGSARRWLGSETTASPGGDD